LFLAEIRAHCRLPVPLQSNRRNPRTDKY